MTVRVLLVDDHPIVRAGVRALLDVELDLEVVGEADSGMAAIDLARRLRPDVVVADLLLPDMDGVAVTQRIRGELPDTQVLILTGVGEEELSVARAVRAGAIGYVLKNSDVHMLAPAIRSGAAGRAHLSTRAAASLIEGMRASTCEATLTCRERDVLREMAIGRSNKEIAHSLGIALTTVKSYVQAVLAKLGAQSRTQAALLAHRSGMFAADELRAP